jgi:TatD DNase family protein|tara:strand:- start:9592 stop:10413 length:822 start_codon:yes stop_codon:yes gene_type:complete
MTNVPQYEIPLIDIGVNLTHAAFDDNLTSVLDRAQQANISKLIITGTDEKGSTRSLNLCQEMALDYPNMLYATCGIHPHNAKEFNTETIDNLKDLAANKEVVAIGETGLDFHRNFSSPKDQEKVFEAQLELAAELQLPVFLHERDAHQRQLEILRQYRGCLTNAVIHCFTGDQASLFNYLDLDLHIGITGWICDERRGQELQRIAKNIPLNRLMLETDAPYLLPRTMNHTIKKKINEPAFLPWVLSAVASQRIETMLEIAEETTLTSTLFFNL